MPMPGGRSTHMCSKCNALVILVFVSLLDFSDSTPNFGFDSANSCSPNGKMSRRGRAQMLAAIPCDLGKQPFCHLPGSIYPWHAVRRFVHENQGLMKRMYGDVRHISILRDEIQNNEVADVDDMEDAADRYSKMPRGAKYMLHGRDAERDDFGSYKGNDVLMEPHFRPVSTTTTQSTTTTTTTPTTTSSTSSTTTIAPPAVAVAKPERERVREKETERERPSLESNSVYELPGSTTTTTSTTKRPQPTEKTVDNIQIIDSPQLGGSPKGVEGSLRNLSISAVPATLATVVKATTVVPTKRTTTLASRKSATPTTTTPTSTAAAAAATAAAISSGSITSTTTAALLARRNSTKTTLGSTTPVSFASLFSSTFTALSSDKQRRPLTTSTTSAPPPMSSTKAGLLREGGQLFQDAMKQEPVAVSSNMRGVNACPVKDEVVAPFWANNTRGEVLALLNLYPFEQYVHWEKCTHEFKQMFCRDGCRCEQQYRLHRLLAYDPHNECRGIFSDWFRFPSSCICKCYNIPMEFRATSRSPRSDSSFDAPQSPPADPVGAAEAEVQRAIYEHATDQWYRPRDEFDFFEG
ncbi:protein spaetzle 4 [Drosophila innubila]|uniref:protein spaetzle 4 n=1 Tax=Drosophila innubila TaxID=198719 RepID=UPI00148B7004|nr:protein spaetzle 4 [Drosophila innubila]